MSTVTFGIFGSTTSVGNGKEAFYAKFARSVNESGMSSKSGRSGKFLSGFCAEFDDGNVKMRGRDKSRPYNTV